MEQEVKVGYKHDIVFFNLMILDFLVIMWN